MCAYESRVVCACVYPCVCVFLCVCDSLHPADLFKNNCLTDTEGIRSNLPSCHLSSCSFWKYSRVSPHKEMQ